MDNVFDFKRKDKVETVKIIQRTKKNIPCKIVMHSSQSFQNIFANSTIDTINIMINPI